MPYFLCFTIFLENFSLLISKNHPFLVPIFVISITIMKEPNIEFIRNAWDCGLVSKERGKEVRDYQKLILGLVQDGNID